jgi:hypothetical protein
MKLINETVAFMTGLVFMGSAASAQKLPSSQEKGVRAPATVKTDGKADEWGGLQAFNRSTELSYTVANDDSTLYLVAQSAVSQVSNKIMRAGITFSVSPSDKKNAKNPVAITFPYIQPPKPIALVPGPNGAGPTMTVVSGSGRQIFQGDAAAVKRQRDSLVYANNLKRIQSFKDIKVKGIPAIADTLISVYNEEGIVTRCSFTQEGLYTYELAIPFKYLGVDIKRPQELAYTVRVEPINSGVPGNVTIVNLSTNSGAASDYQAMDAATHFSGKYLPVKK